MTTESKMMYGLDPSKYPARLGQPWQEDEIVKLLTSIQKKKSVGEIAKEHERTVGSITSYIKKLAIEYYLNDKRPISEIQKFTGLTKEQIEDSVQKHLLKNTANKRVNNKVVKNTIVSEEELPTMLEVVSLLKDIQEKLNTLLEKVS